VDGWWHDWAPHGRMLLQVAGALVAGGLVGIERSFRGRAAGFRTFSLVALGSCLPMIATSHPEFWLYVNVDGYNAMDPTRVIQGIVTGIGFLGAGVIFREGFAVRGLTTAACVWVVSAVGVLIGIGFYLLAAVTTAATLVVLGLFRWIEAWMPAQTYTHVILRFDRASAPGVAEMRKRLEDQGFATHGMSFRANGGGGHFEYRVAVSTSDMGDVSRLVEALRRDSGVIEFRVSPTRE
jgi:putative Mg2+ transporter-C (MgtC) family protein